MSLPIVKKLGIQPYEAVFQQMQQFTDTRTPATTDEFWVLQHMPVFTLGQAGDPSHILNATDIPVVQSDRGGQVTYHGPGQLVVYPLIDLRRYGLGVRSLVELIENAIILLLERYGIESQSRRDAPGVYVKDKKIAALGLRIRRSCSFHGLALNIDMNLEPFSMINPCGYAGLEVTQMVDHATVTGVDEVADQLLTLLVNALQQRQQQSPR